MANDTSESGKFACQACGRTYAWKPQLAGKKVKCKCGAVMTAPATAPLPSAEAAQAPASEPAMASAGKGKPPIPSIVKAAASSAASARSSSQPKAKPAAAATPAEDDSNHDGGDGLDGLYALAAEEKKVARKLKDNPDVDGFRCPSCGEAMNVGAVLCVACGFHIRTGGNVADLKPKKQGAITPMGGVAGTAAARGGGPAPVAAAVAVAAPSGGGLVAQMFGYAPKRADLEQQDLTGHQVTELYAPIALFVIGVILHYLHYTVWGSLTLPPLWSLPVIGIRLVIDMVLLSVACLATVHLVQVALGNPATAALKVAAIACSAGAIATVSGDFFPSGLGLYIEWGVALLMYYALFFWLFDFDGMDIYILTSIVWLVRTWIGYALILIILRVLVGGGIIGGMGATALSALSGGVAQVGAQAKFNRDRHIREQMDLWTGVTTARKHLEGSPARQFGELTRPQSEALLSKLESLGASEIHIIPRGDYAMTPIVELPRSSAKRKAIFDFHAEWMSKRSGRPAKDEGQRFIIWNIDMELSPKMLEDMKKWEAEEEKEENGDGGGKGAGDEDVSDGGSEIVVE